MKDITVFIPVYNAQTTLLETLNSLENQTTENIKEILIMDDGSTDSTIDIIQAFSKRSKYNVRLVKNKVKMGLAEKYNSVIFSIDTNYLVLVHADIKILEKDAIEKYHNLITTPGVSGCVAFVAHSFDDWKKYSFWQKVEFDRKIKRTLQGLGGKFDMFSVKDLKKIGGFDSKRYRIAGEDWDMFFRIQTVGKLARSSRRYLHQHSFDPNYGLNTLIKKQARYSEAAAVVYRNHRKRFSLKTTIFTFFRELISLFFVANLFFALWFKSFVLMFPSLLLIIIYLVLYAKNTYTYEYKNPKVFVLPFVLLYLIPVSNFYTIKGFITNRQTI